MVLLSTDPKSHTRGTAVGEARQPSEADHKKGCITHTHGQLNRIGP